MIFLDTFFDNLEKGDRIKMTSPRRVFTKVTFIRTIAETRERSLQRESDRGNVGIGPSNEKKQSRATEKHPRDEGKRLAILGGSIREQRVDNFSERSLKRQSGHVIRAYLVSCSEALQVILFQKNYPLKTRDIATKNNGVTEVFGVSEFQKSLT